MYIKQDNHESFSIPNISRSDYAFLVRMRIPTTEIFDCKGLSAKRLRPKMKGLGKTVGVNTTPCLEHGHTIRTRVGHCLQCSPENYGFLKQYISGGYAYISESRSTGLLKVGITGNLARREYWLNYFEYANISDWEIRDNIYVPERVGDVENNTHKALAQFIAFRTYTLEGEEVDCQEVFDCPVVTAQKALHEACNRSVHTMATGRITVH